VVVAAGLAVGFGLNSDPIVENGLAGERSGCRVAVKSGSTTSSFDLDGGPRAKL
jgi:hypothetical protein